MSQGHGGAFSFTSSIVYLKECLWSKEQRYGQSKGEEDILKRQLMKQLLLGLLSDSFCFCVENIFEKNKFI